ncbi:uncharacterized protein LOC127244180 isoform X2 [Andrographis paniculata]|uniref:uncharacterized protein LOC127244180 isoform X2 n=1 Tax=Andrographis paniculata TaxID=175694 RepID=UPI0021E7EC3C|nr:uncharacterized protein LOC127244180 isoform X2 [Andrographis paniculata]
MALNLISPSAFLHFLSNRLSAGGFPSVPRRRPASLFCCQLSQQQQQQQTSPRLGIPSPPGRIDCSLLSVSAACSEEELWAAACLRVRTFYDFDPEMFGIEDHKRYLAEHEFEALKERVAGKSKGFRKVSCINATLPTSVVLNISDDLCPSCKGIGADFARAYISNVCVAKELHRNGLGYELIQESKRVAEHWGIRDLYVHVAVDNEGAKNLYLKSGFELESEEPAWQARFLNRPRRLLLWTALPITYEL